MRWWARRALASNSRIAEGEGGVVVLSGLAPISGGEVNQGPRPDQLECGSEGEVLTLGGHDGLIKVVK